MKNGYEQSEYVQVKSYIYVYVCVLCISSILTLKIKNCIEDKKHEIDDRVYQVHFFKIILSLHSRTTGHSSWHNCEVNFVGSSITMYNIWCLLWQCNILSDIYCDIIL